MQSSKVPPLWTDIWPNFRLPVRSLGAKFVIAKDDRAVIVSGVVPDKNLANLVPIVDKLDGRLAVVRAAHPGYTISVTGLRRNRLRLPAAGNLSDRRRRLPAEASRLWSSIFRHRGADGFFRPRAQRLDPLPQPYDERRQGEDPARAVERATVVMGLRSFSPPWCWLAVSPRSSSPIFRRFACSAGLARLRWCSRSLEIS
jgi:hypothetical protein